MVIETHVFPVNRMNNEHKKQSLCHNDTDRDGKCSPLLYHKHLEDRICTFLSSFLLEQNDYTNSYHPKMTDNIITPNCIHKQS